MIEIEMEPRLGTNCTKTKLILNWNVCALFIFAVECLVVSHSSLGNSMFELEHNTAFQISIRLQKNMCNEIIVK